MPGAAAENTMANSAPKKPVGYIKEAVGRAKKEPARLDQFTRHHHGLADFDDRTPDVIAVVPNALKQLDSLEWVVTRHDRHSAHRRENTRSLSHRRLGKPLPVMPKQTAASSDVPCNFHRRRAAPHR